MARPFYHGKRRKVTLSMYDKPFLSQSVQRSKEIIQFFKEAPELAPVLDLFKKRKSVSKKEIEAVISGAVTRLTAKGVIRGQKGGKAFELTRPAKEALDQMQK